MNENTTKSIVVNFILDEEDPALESNTNTTPSIHPDSWPAEDFAQGDFLIQDMFLDHFFP
jgi:hypothetical protein